jgi:hypothetical protein
MHTLSLDAMSEQELIGTHPTLEIEFVLKSSGEVTS